MTARSVILQETLDVVELDLRPGRIGQAAAQFLEDPAHPLDVDFAGNHLRELVAEFVRTQRPSQRVGAVGAGLLAAVPFARAIALTVAVTLLLFLAAGAAGCGVSGTPVDSPSSPLGAGGDSVKECVPDPSGTTMTNGWTVLENHSTGTAVVE